MTRKVKKEKNYHSPNKTVIMKRLSNLFFNVFRALALWVFTVFPVDHL